MREAVCELAFGHAAERLVAVPYYTVTYLLVAGAYLISVLVPSIYVSLSVCLFLAEQLVFGVCTRAPVFGRLCIHLLLLGSLRRAACAGHAERPNVELTCIAMPVSLCRDCLLSWVRLRR